MLAPHSVFTSNAVRFSCFGNCLGPISFYSLYFSRGSFSLICKICIVTHASYLTPGKKLKKQSPVVYLIVFLLSAGRAEPHVPVVVGSIFEK